MSIRNFNETPEKSMLNRVITNPKAVDNSNEFTSDGLFSRSIFGDMSNIIEYRCDCNTLTGRYREGIKCGECNTRVIKRDLMVDNEGFIELSTYVIHPVLLRYLRRLIGPKRLTDILTYNNEYDIDGNIDKAPPLKYPYVGIGYVRFREHAKEIIKTIMERRKTNEKAGLFVLANFDSLFTNIIPVTNARLRPAMLIGDEFSFDVVNTHYSNLISSSNMIDSLTNAEDNITIFERLTAKCQDAVNLIYTYTIDAISGKGGAIRGSLLGNRLNFSSRMVITPLGANSRIDDIEIPYIVAVELFKPVIVRKLSILKDISLTSAEDYWRGKLSVIDTTIYKILEEIVEKESVRILSNRNPTIAVGSMLSLRLAGIKQNYNDSTASIHNLILKPLGGDYDGENLPSLNFFNCLEYLNS